MTNRSAMIMAGGSGTRMAQSGGSVTKPLVSVAGVAMLERNFQQLLRFGFNQIFIAVAHENKEIKAFIKERLTPLAKITCTDLNIVEEYEVCGNIGAAGLLAESCDNLLVVFSDNITSIDLSSIWSNHIEKTGDLTLACHNQSFRMPFGELLFDADRSVLTDYIEKPHTTIAVSSAVSVLGPWTLSLLESMDACGLSQLSKKALCAGRQVNVFQHEAPWIDVNDMGTIKKAEALIASHFNQFEYWWPHSESLMRSRFMNDSADHKSSIEDMADNILSVADLNAGEILTVCIPTHGQAEIPSDCEVVRREISKRIALLSQTYSSLRPAVDLLIS